MTKCDGIFVIVLDRFQYLNRKHVFFKIHLVLWNIIVCDLLGCWDSNPIHSNAYILHRNEINHRGIDKMDYEAKVFYVDVCFLGTDLVIF